MVTEFVLNPAVEWLESDWEWSYGNTLHETPVSHFDNGYPRPMFELLDDGPALFEAAISDVTDHYITSIDARIATVIRLNPETGDEA